LQCVDIRLCKVVKAVKSRCLRLVLCEHALSRPNIAAFRTNFRRFADTARARNQISQLDLIALHTSLQVVVI
jgi:hypothetical protein